jgi:alanyl-tRNA synthetase
LIAPFARIRPGFGNLIPASCAMTERLYYQDSFLKHFAANVVACDPDGSRWKVVLDRTAFYPTSGGQPHDLGTLGGAQVLEVSDAEDHIVHYTSAELPRGAVEGRIDWPRRFDHMQQHTAQHLLSAAFIELFGIQTVSFHLGEELCTIDLKAPALAQHQLDEAERRANEIIFEDRVVEIRFGTAAELAEIGVRKEVDREGVLRAIRVEGFDFQPCGGTHLARTGQAGLVLLRKNEKRRDAVRVEFVAGGRALGVARRDYAILSEAAAKLTCGLAEVPAGIVKLAEDRRAQSAEGKRLENRLADLEAAQLTNGPDEFAARTTIEGSRVISSILETASPSFLTLLASKIVSSSDSSAPVIILLGEAASGHVAFAQTKAAKHDVGAILRTALAAIPGKGGGGRDFAQATLSDPATLKDFLASASNALTASPR